MIEFQGRDFRLTDVHEDNCAATLLRCARYMPSGG
jgi:hypothetical protein